MRLKLEVIGPKAAQMGAGVRKVFHGGGTIGRLDDNDWVFPDQYISARHAKISLVGGCYLIEDTSTNGVFINSPRNRIPRGRPQPLHDGDTVFIDDYEVRVCLEGDAPVEPIGGLSSQYHRPPPPATPPSLLTQPLEFPSDAVASQLIPDEYDPRAAGDASASMRAPADRSTSRSAALPARPALRRRSPAELAPASPDAHGPRDTPRSGRGADPQDAPAAKGAPLPRGGREVRDAPAPRGGPEGRIGPKAPVPRAGPAAKAGADAPAARKAQPSARTTVLIPAAPSRPPNGSPKSSPHDSPNDSPNVSANERRSVRAGSRSSNLDFAALLAGAGLEAAQVSPELAAQFGQIMRVVVAGLMDVLQARGTIKDEFRMRSASIKQRDDNPLKFSANVDDALHNILVKRNTAYLGPVEAFEDAFQDVRNHQMAMLAGMRVAYDEMLAEFDPQHLQKDFDEQAKSFLSGSAKQMYWELYCARFRDMVRDADSCFRRLFGDEFAQAYEEQLARLKALKRTDRQ